MDGDVSWLGVSGVPGLGCSLKNCYKYSSVLKLWEEGKDDQENVMKKKSSLGGKIVKLLSFRRNKSVQETTSPSVSLPKVTVRRSVSEVKASNQIKVNHSGSSKCCENIIIPNNKSNIRSCESCDTDIIPSSNRTIKRSKSLQSEKKKKIERKGIPLEQSLGRSKPVNIVKDSPSVTFPCLALPHITYGKSAHRKLLKTSSTQHQPVGTLDKDREDVKKCQATQTDILDEVIEEKEYDYVYSNFVTPAMLIKLSEEDENENIYEEINHQDRKMPKHDSLFFSISQGRREQLEMYRFSGWDLNLEINRGEQIDKECIIDKNNYVKSQAIKSELEDTIIKRNMSLHRTNTKETKKVTFAVDDSAKLKRNKSVNVSSHRMLSSNL